MAKNSKSERRLRTGLEIAADRVIAARADNSGAAVETIASRTLPAGTVAPSLMTDNIQDRIALVNAVREALASVGPKGKDVAVVLPDASSRHAPTTPARRSRLSRRGPCLRARSRQAS